MGCLTRDCRTVWGEALLGIEVELFLILPENYYMTINNGKTENGRECLFSIYFVSGALRMFTPRIPATASCTIPAAPPVMEIKACFNGASNLYFSLHVLLLPFT